MTNEYKRWLRDYRVAAAACLAAFLSVVAALGAWLFPLPWSKGGQLVAHRQSIGFIPFADRLPTAVSVQNIGNRESLIQSAALQNLRWKKTPPREAIYGAGPPIPVNFTKRHLSRDESRFSIWFQNPKAVPPEEWTTLQVAVIDPAWLGNTCVCDLVIFYDGDQQLIVEDVELDALAETPVGIFDGVE